MTRAAQRVCAASRTGRMLDYVEEPGIYRARQVRPIADPNLATWMIAGNTHELEDRSISPSIYYRASNSICPILARSRSQPDFIGKQRRLEI